MATTINYLDAKVASEKAANDTLIKVREALVAKDMDAYAEQYAKLERQVKSHNGAIMNCEYDRLSKESDPVIAAVKQFYVELKRVVETKDKDTGRVTGVNIETKKARIDLAKFYDFAKLDKSWINDTTRLLTLLVSRKKDLLAMTHDKLAKESLIVQEVVEELKEGKTPNSKTQIVKLIQAIVDSTIFVDNGKGENVYRCTNHDILFIDDAIMKFNAKEKCTLDSMNPRQFQSVMMSVFAHILGEAYTIKEAKSRKSKDEPSLPEAPTESSEECDKPTEGVAEPATDAPTTSEADKPAEAVVEPTMESTEPTADVPSTPESDKPTEPVEAPATKRRTSSRRTSPKKSADKPDEAAPATESAEA